MLSYSKHWLGQYSFDHLYHFNNQQRPLQNNIVLESLRRCPGIYAYEFTGG